MAKNLMPEISKLLGVEIGKEFIVKNADSGAHVVLAMDGLHIGYNGYLERPNGNLLQKVLCGMYEVEKLPWEPKYKECYYCPSVTEKRVIKLLWLDDTRDYAMKALGMVYCTKAAAEEHLAEDYERLMGKKLEANHGREKTET